MARLILFLLAAVSILPAQQRRLLYVTHSAGFVHGSLNVSRRVMEDVGRRAGIEVTATEDLSQLNAARLRDFDAVFFFTSGELGLSPAQKLELLAWVRSGKGFGGVHSATDTLYQWPEYGDLIGGYFDGHPWVHEAGVDIEDPGHPATRALPVAFRLVEEFYQFRAFSRDRVRVLMTLDPATINLRLPGVNRTDEDFALAWVRPYGEGRVFYTALGHFDETWLDARFQSMLEGALRFLTGLDRGEAAARRSTPVIARLAPLALGEVTADVIAPGALIAIAGTGLTTGSTMEATAPAAGLPVRLAGTQVRINGAQAGLYSVTPERILARVPTSLVPGEPAALELFTGGPQSVVSRQLRVEAAAPAIAAVARSGDVLVIAATGLGAATPDVLAGDRPLPLDYAGPAPGYPGLSQINARIPADLAAGAQVRIRAAGKDSNAAAIP